jgi:hypothetical protein
MSAATVKCPKCGRAVAPGAPGSTAKVPCPGCGSVLLIRRTPSQANLPAAAVPPNKPAPPGASEKPGPAPAAAADKPAPAAGGIIPLEESGDSLPTIKPVRKDKAEVWDYFEMMTDSEAPTAESAKTAATEARPAGRAEARPAEGAPPAEDGAPVTDSGKMPLAAISALAQGERIAPARPAGSESAGEGAAEPPDPLIGKTLGGCAILRKLGQGGMGSVYEARQLSLDRRVALKVLSPSLSANSEFLDRFQREALAAARLAHHNVVQIFDVGAAGGHHFFTMELVRGETLSQIRKREEKLNMGKALRYALQAARGLQFAHEHDIIHRDVKPANLMLNEQGLIKVADLGLAKQLGHNTNRSDEGDVVTAVKLREMLAGELTAAEAALGTPGFMAPEQVGAPKKVDGRADIYALGATLHQLLTGKLPFPAKNLMEMLRKQTAQPLPELPALSGQPEQLVALLRRMLAPDPEDRPGSMQEIVLELEAILSRFGRATGPTAEMSAALAKCADRYAEAQAAAPWVGPVLTAAISLLLIGLGLAMNRADLATVGLVLPMTALPAFTVMEAVTGRSVLCRRLLDAAAGARMRTHVQVFVVLAGAIAMAAAAGLLLPLIAGVAAGGAMGMIGHALVRLLSAGAAGPLEAANRTITRMRAAEIDEFVLQETLLSCGAARPEPLFEALFGWPALETARRRVSARSTGAAVSTGLRDRLMRRLDRLERLHREDERRHMLLEDETRAADDDRARQQTRLLKQADARKAEVMDKLSKMAEEVAELERHEGELALRVGGFKGESKQYLDQKEKLRRLRAKLYAKRTEFDSFRRSALGIVRPSDEIGADLELSFFRIAAGVLLTAAAFALPTEAEAGKTAVGRLLRMDSGGVTAANAVFAGLALIISGLKRGSWAGRLTALGGLIAWPAAAFAGDLKPEMFSARPMDWLPASPGGFPVVGGLVFWPGFALFAAGLVMMVVQAALPKKADTKAQEAGVV